MLRFRIFGVPFVVTTYFWIGCVILGGIGDDFSGFSKITQLAIWVACVFVSIVVHELGHALVGRAYGASPIVTLHGIGGLTFLPGARLNRPRSILVSLAGPAAGLALYAICSSVHWPEDPGNATLAASDIALQNLIFINGVWTLFNLLPILPLDGGQVLRAALGPRWIGLTRAVGGVTAALVAALELRVGQIFIAIFLAFLAYRNFKGDPRALPGGVAQTP